MLNHILSSSILDQKQIISLMELIGFTDQFKWKLLYRATEDGFSAQNFHSKCDKFPNTLTVIKSEHGNVFGGFTTKLWSVENDNDREYVYKFDNESFIFSFINILKKPLKFVCTGTMCRIWCSKINGPSFGVLNLVISDNSNVYNNSYSIMSSEDSYKSEKIELKSRSFLAGSDYFVATEIESFSKANTFSFIKIVKKRKIYYRNSLLIIT